MNEWGVVGVLIALVGFVFTLVKPVVVLNTTITELTQIVKRLQSDVEELTTRNSSAHARLFDRIEKDEKDIANHETRLTILEKKEVPR